MPRLLLASALLALSGCAAFAQSFEVASIKPSPPPSPGRMLVGMRGGPGTADPGQLTITNMGLGDLIQYAWNVKSYQVQGPGWLDSARFDIIARIPSGATVQDARVMMRNLLAERFGLVLHHATREASVYALLVAKNGPKLKEAAPDPGTAAGSAPDAPAPDAALRAPVTGKDGFPQLPPGAGRRGAMMMMAPGGRVRVVANGSSIAKFLDVLAMQLDRPIVDETGLKGAYDITLDFAPDPAVMQARMAAMGASPPPGMASGGPMDGGRGPAAGAPDDNNAATIFTALTEQLGLRLEARKGPVDMLVIDSARKTPLEN